MVGAGERYGGSIGHVANSCLVAFDPSQSAVTPERHAEVKQNPSSPRVQNSKCVADPFSPAPPPEQVKAVSQDISVEETDLEILPCRTRLSVMATVAVSRTFREPG